METITADERKIIVDEKNPTVKPISKYSIVPVFWKNPTEVAASEFVASFDNSGRTYLNFIDEDGRLWKGAIEQFVIIKNLPNQEDIEDFMRMKKESDEMGKEMTKKRKENERLLNKKDDAFR